MLKLLLARFFDSFNADTVNEALEVFNRAVDRLQVIADTNIRKAAEHALSVKEAQAAEALALAEADRAKVVVSKLKDMIGGA